MSTAHNPFKPGDRVRIQRGAGWLFGEVIKTILARCHIRVDSEDGDGNVFVDNYHDVQIVCECDDPNTSLCCVTIRTNRHCTCMCHGSVT